MIITLIFIFQVRQQSKLISKQSIERVQRERQRQNELIRRRKEQEMKLWREQNVEKLQKIYKNCMEEIGQGHKAATEYRAQEQDELKKREIQQEKAAQRGKEAAERLEKQKLMKQKKKFVNKLKQKSVSIQTENNRLHEIGLKLGHDADLSLSSSEEMIDEPHVNFKESASKTILSSDDDVEEVKIRSDLTCEENKDKRQQEPKLIKLETGYDDGYDQLMSDYKSVYGRAQHPLHRPFSKLSDLVRGRTDIEIRKPSVRFDDYSSSYKLIDNVRSLTDKERLASLLDNPPSQRKVNQPVSSPKKIPVTIPEKLIPKNPGQRPKFAVPKDNPIRIPGQARTIPLIQSVAKLKADEELERQKQQKYQSPVKRLPAGSAKTKSTGPTTTVRADYEALEKELAVLTKQISSGHNAYNFSVEKLAKDSRTRQNKMEAAFVRAARQQAPVTVVPSQTKGRQTINVASTPEKVTVESSPDDSPEYDVEDEQLRRLQVLLGRINQQKQEVQQAMNESKIELEQKRKIMKPTTTDESELMNHNNLLRSLLSHRQKTLEIEARELRLSQMEEKIERLIRECSLKYKRINRTRGHVIEVIGGENSTTSTIESSTDATTVEKLPKQVIINLGDLIKKKKKMTKHSSLIKEAQTVEKSSQVPDLQAPQPDIAPKQSNLQIIQQPPIDIQTITDDSSSVSEKPTTSRDKLNDKSKDKSKDLDKYLNQISAEKEALEKVDVSSKSIKSGAKKKQMPKPKKPIQSYIKCLLKMSKKEIDELSVSSVSSVSTPNVSVIETPANRLRAGNVNSDPTEPYLAELENFLTNNITEIPSNSSHGDQLSLLTNLVAGVLKKFLLDLTRRISPISPILGSSIE